MRVVSNYVRSLRTYHTATKAFACLLGSLLMELSVGLREFLAEFSRKPLRHGLSRATSPKWEAQMAGGLCVKSALRHTLSVSQARHLLLKEKA